MIRHQRTRQIDAAPDEVWAVLGRFMHIDEFAPQVASVEALTDGAVGVGSRRRCTFENGGDMVEEVTAWEPGQSFRVRLSETAPIPLSEGHAFVKIAPAGAGATRVDWGMDYRMKYGPLGWLLGQTMVKAMMGKVIEANLDGLATRVRAIRTA